MGVCGNTKKEDTLSSIFKGSKKNLKNSTIKSDFYIFTEWILNFKFYIKLNNNNDKTIKLITNQSGPNENNIFKIIKSLDQLEGKELHEFTLHSLSLQSSRINANINSKNSSENTNINFKRKNPSEIREDLNILFDKLCKLKMKKVNKILLIGPPNNIRWLMWFSIAKNKYIEIESKLGINNSQIYSFLINSKINDEFEKKINKDLQNSFPNIKFFNNANWLNSLFNLLKAYSIYDKEIGYKNGMNKIIANILMLSDCNEIESFQLIRFFFSNSYGLSLRDFFMENSPKFNFYSFLIMELIRERLFPVYEIINKLQIEKEIWLDKLIINLFGSFFDFSIGIRLYDCMIAFGLNFLINFTLGFLKNYQKIILNFKDKNSFISFFLGKYKFKTDNDIYIERERIIKLALEINISQATIMRISDKYNHQMKMRNLNELIYKNTITNKKDNYKIINKELEIIELISESINGKEFIEEIKKEEKNIFDNNKNMNGKRKNIKNYKNNIENHLINNNLNEIEIEKNENENEINTSKKRTLSDRIVINEIVDDEEDEQLNLRKVFPSIKNNHLNFDVNRINKNQKDIIDEKEIEESQNSKIKKEEEDEIKEIIKDKKEKKDEEIKEIINDKKEEEDEIKEIIKDKKEKKEDEIKEIIKDKKEEEEDEIKEIIKDKKEEKEDEIKEIIKDKKEEEEDEIKEIIKDKNEKDEIKEIIKDKKEKEEDEIKEIIKNKKENEKDEIKEIIKDKKEENKIEEDKKEENNSNEENTIELESEDSVIPIDNSSSDISFEEENMIKMSKKLNHG